MLLNSGENENLSQQVGHFHEVASDLFARSLLGGKQRPLINMC